MHCTYAAAGGGGGAGADCVRANPGGNNGRAAADVSTTAAEDLVPVAVDVRVTSSKILAAAIEVSIEGASNWAGTREENPRGEVKIPASGAAVMPGPAIPIHVVVADEVPVAAGTTERR